MSSPTIAYNPKAFNVKLNKLGEELPRKESAGRKCKSRRIDAMQHAVEKIGNAEQQLLVMHGLLKRPAGNALVTALKGAVNPDELDIAGNIESIMKKSAATQAFFDTKTFQRTLLMSIVPTLDSTSRRSINALARKLGLKSRNFNRRFKEAVAARSTLMSSTQAGRRGGIPFVQTFVKDVQTMYTPEFIARLHEWVLLKCDLVVPSPNADKSVLVRCPLSGEKIRQQKYFYISSVRELHLELIKPLEEGGFDGATNPVDGKVLISDTLLRSYMPRNLSRLTDAQKNMCGCELCIILGKEITLTLNAWERRTLKALVVDANSEIVDAELKQQKLAIADLFRQQTLTVDHVNRFKHPRDIVKAMTCAPCAVTGLHKMKCCLDRCDECPLLPIPDLETDVSEGSPFISFEVYEYHSFCTEHLSLPGAPSKCPHCTEIREAPPVDGVTPTTGILIRKQQLTRKTKRIGHFVADYLVPFMKKYRYHLLHVALLGKNHCVGQRKAAFNVMPGSVLTQRDYADTLVTEFNNQIQSTHFGENVSVSMEGVTVRFNNQFHYYCYVSDDKRQDSRTTYVNVEAMVKAFRLQGLLQEGSSLGELMDGCSKQYRCGNAMYLMSVMATKYRIRLDRMISAPHHGKGDCDSQGGIDKNYIRRKFQLIATAGVNDSKFIQANTVDETGKRISMAERLVSLLSDPSRVNGVKGSRKNLKRELAAAIQERQYHVMHHGNLEKEANTTLPIMNSTFKVKSGYKHVNGERNNGITAHYHFVADYQLGVGRIVSRRIPCGCLSCRQTLNLPWDDTITVALEQPRYQRPPNCAIDEVVGDLNAWKLLEIEQSNVFDEDDIVELFEDVLGEYEASAARQIHTGSFGAYDSPDGYYLVRWSSEPFSLEDDSVDVEGCPGILPAGNIVCHGVYWNEVRRATRWYTPPSGQAPPQEHTFRVRYVVKAVVDMQDPSPNNQLPANRRDRNSIYLLGPKRITEATENAIVAEKARRATIDYEEGAVQAQQEGLEELEDDHGGDASDSSEED